jgi:hypothetical protein
VPEGGRTISWSLEGPPPDELLVIAPEYGLARYGEGVRPQGVEQVEVMLTPDGRITSVKLFPSGYEVLEPESLDAALDELAQRLQQASPSPWPMPPAL